MTAGIQVAGLTKSFGSVRAVDEIDFAVAAGRVTGFLGPNGAGKTTTLRMLLGLIRPDAGTTTIDGRSYVDIPAPVSAVGAALDPGAGHPGRRARDQLRITCRRAGIPTIRADAVLADVGLTDAGRRRIGTFSTGMRQRLQLAGALLGDPAVLRLLAEFAVRKPAPDALVKRLESLTPREREVLGHVARGSSNAEVATELGHRRGDCQDARRAAAREARRP